MTVPFSRVDRQVAIPGILGGLGPLAHVHFEQLLIQRSVERGARGDRDHPVWMLMNAATVPDRTQSLLGHAPDCTPELVRYARMLERAGAGFLIVPCNSAHGFYDAVQAQIELPWLHLMACTSRYLRQAHPAVQRVGVLATDGTVWCGLYSRSLAQAGLTPLGFELGSPWQGRVMDAIYHPDWGIKTTGTQVSTEALTVLEQATAWLATQGAELVIAGCTELSVAFAQMRSLPLPWVDPLAVAADLTLDLAWGYRSLPLWQAA
jgi:aspartate racemase